MITERELDRRVYDLTLNTIYGLVNPVSWWIIWDTIVQATDHAVERATIRATEQSLH